MGPIAKSIKQKLEKSFSPKQLKVIDESHKHAHHKGAQEHAAIHGSGESHFHVIIAAPRLEGLSRVAAHRAVMDVLADEMKNGIHALRLDIVKG
ncbi:MAG TPA: BolA family transcriptional regulator [Rhizobiales bacterium]|nr:BolA family transcriptional regulator [Hyphomicrobiales bacterium]